MMLSLRMKILSGIKHLWFILTQISACHSRQLLANPRCSAAALAVEYA
jgi:hypothetical protein